MSSLRPSESKRSDLLRGEVPLTPAQQQNITRLTLWAGQLLFQYGAESHHVEATMHRLATGLGCDWADISIAPDGITLTTVYQKNFITKVRRVLDRGINMRVVCDVSRLVSEVEHGVAECHRVEKQLRRLSDKPIRYNRWFVILMVGLSCACFARLSGADLWAFAGTFVASATAMFVRQELAHRHLNPMLTFCCTAFVATGISSVVPFLQLGDTPKLAMSACVLLLVPGFPLINSISDMVKGHMGTGIARWGMASLLTLDTAIGIVASMSVTGVWAWIS